MGIIEVGFQLMGYGLATVFLTLIILYVSIRLMVALAKKKAKSDG